MGCSSKSGEGDVRRWNSRIRRGGAGVNGCPYAKRANLGGWENIEDVIDTYSGSRMNPFSHDELKSNIFRCSKQGCPKETNAELSCASTRFILA